MAAECYDQGTIGDSARVPIRGQGRQVVFHKGKAGKMAQVMTGPARRRLHGVVLGFAALALLAADEPGDDSKQADSADKAAAAEDLTQGFLVQIPLPITDEVDLQVRQEVDRVVAAETSERPVLVLEFINKGTENLAGSQFERSLAIARFLASQRMARVRTVAYLPESVFGHAMLPVLACEQIVMHPEAELGKILDEGTDADELLRYAYRDIAERRRTVPAALVLGMLDKDVAVHRVELDGTRYVTSSEFEKLIREGKVSGGDTVIPAGQIPSFTGTQWSRELKVVSHLVDDRSQLEAVLRLAPGSLTRDPAAQGGWKSVQVELRGTMNAQVVNSIRTMLAHHIATEDPNLVLVWIDSEGGSFVDSLTLAEDLADFDSDKIRTVAFVKNQALADAALIALACDQLVMHEDAKLGGGGYHVGESDRESNHKQIRHLAQVKNRNWSLMAALADPRAPDLSVARYERAGTGEVRYFCPAELEAQPDSDRWNRQGEDIDTLNGFTATRATDVGLTENVVASFSDVERIYDLSESPRKLQPLWSDIWVQKLAAFLTRPMIAGMLLFGAWFCLSTEMSQPGLSVPGFLAALFFTLFFWSHFLSGTAGWLEVLLFVLGAGCIALELFVIPGFGIFGIGGAIMVVSSIVLASQSFIVPRNAYEVGKLPASLSMVLVAMAGVIAAMLFMRKVLPHSPYLNRMLLEPPGADELDERRRRESLVQWDHLSGKQGVTTTQLMPSGKARFGDDVVDVISSGEVIARDTQIVVADVRGSRIEVHPVAGDSD